jgi:hypothetical protein
VTIRLSLTIAFHRITIMPEPLWQNLEVDGRRYHCADFTDSSSCIDITEITWPPENDVRFYVAVYKFVLPFLFGMVSLVGLVGNSLVAFVIMTEAKMRTTVNLLLLNLAFSDIIFAVICVPLVTYHFAAENWLLGDVACKLYNFFVYVCVYVTVYTLVGISVVRYMAIVCSHRSSRFRTKRNICVGVGILWAVMLVINCPVILLYRVKQFKAENSTSVPYLYCGMKDVDTGKNFNLSFFCLTYLIPLTFICTFYVLLLRYLRLQRKGSSINHNQRSSRKSHAKTALASKILIVVVGVFGIFWLPYHIHLLIAYFGYQPEGDAYQVLRLFFYFLAYANSMMNPLIYNYVSQDFRSSFKRFYRQYICCSGEEQEGSGSDHDEQLPEENRLQKASNYSAL